ncbi:MAG TPA: hypothetical protein VNZ22_07005 [Bacillota bacterium]|nr:hypothetical protein [Bacillota bacterium]
MTANALRPRSRLIPPPWRLVQALLPIFWLGLGAAFPVALAQTLSPAEAAKTLAPANERFWRSCANPPEGLSSRTLFAYALVLAEAGEHPERLERLFELASQMQDRDPKSRGYGNFRWYWRDAKVMDYNAVDFCMRGGSLLWLKHREFIPAPARDRLRPILELAAEGCLRHKVKESYSNIALMNAGDLILLGEALGQPTVAAEGYARLDRVFQYTQQAGVHEYVSPTYTGVDLDGLGMIEAFCRQERGRAQARALLELFWTDIALNWFPPAQRLAGAHSRTYDFLRGLGYLDVQLALNGWLKDQPLKELDAIYGVQAKWHPSARTTKLSQQFPRLVRQSWGDQPWHSRTHYLCADITLSSSASSYGGRMDMPLTVDLPGERTAVRCYFLADGRDDPYGKNKIEAGPHAKAFHLDPLWSAVQRDGEALGLVIYRPKDLPTNAVHLNSNFVLPLQADEWRVGQRRVKFAGDKPLRIPVPPGEVVALRRGTAALGLRIAWSRACDGKEATAALVYDGNTFGAVRLVVEHAPAGQTPVMGPLNPGAAFWVRIGSGLQGEEAFTRWHDSFSQGRMEATTTINRVHVQAAGTQGPLKLEAGAPWSVPGLQEPPPSRAVLEWEGRDGGKEMLSAAVRKLGP